MKYFAKFVTGILLIALSAIPMLATDICRPSEHSKTCCGGVACPMMAKMGHNKAADHTGTKSAPSSCCEMTTYSLVAVTPENAPERPLSLAILHERHAAFFPPFVRTWNHGLTYLGLRSPQRSQAALCTFLI